VLPDRRLHRPIRSYVLRTGRMTTAQQRAFEQHWQRWGLRHEDGLICVAEVFGRRAPVVMEVGFGMGHSLVQMAEAAPQTDFIGVEVHKPGVGRLLHDCAERDLGNIRVYCHDAVEVLRDCIARESLDGVQIFFPDPWHKKRQLMASRLRHGGTLHLATDWENYAQQMMEVLTACTALRNACGQGQYAPRPPDRPLTRFEGRGERLGHGVWDLVFERC